MERQPLSTGTSHNCRSFRAEQRFAHLAECTSLPIARLEGDWDVEPEQAWSAASESSLNPMSRLEDVSWLRAKNRALTADSGSRTLQFLVCGCAQMLERAQARANLSLFRSFGATRIPASVECHEAWRRISGNQGTRRKEFP